MVQVSIVLLYHKMCIRRLIRPASAYLLAFHGEVSPLTSNNHPVSPRLILLASVNGREVLPDLPTLFHHKGLARTAYSRIVMLAPECHHGRNLQPVSHQGCTMILLAKTRYARHNLRHQRCTQVHRACIHQVLKRFHRLTIHKSVHRI